METNRNCVNCKETKALTTENFYKRGSDGFESSCKSCRKKRWKKYYSDHLDLERTRSRERKRNRTEDQRERSRIAERKLSKTSKGIFRIYRRNAKKRSIAFSITEEFFINLLNKNCAYCGDSSRGVDRVINSIGYTPENCVSCCDLCNRMKNKFPVEKFLNHCKKIAKFVPFPSIESLEQDL